LQPSIKNWISYGLSELKLAMGEQIKSWNSVKSLREDDGELDVIFNSEAEVKKLIADARSKAQATIMKMRPKEPTQQMTMVQSNFIIFESEDFD
jgi:hypothetical protein